jgi:hypothetical protein
MVNPFELEWSQAIDSVCRSDGGGDETREDAGGANGEARAFETPTRRQAAQSIAARVTAEIPANLQIVRWLSAGVE